MELTINGEKVTFTKEELSEDDPTLIAKNVFSWGARAADAKLEADLSSNAIDVWKAEAGSAIAKGSRTGKLPEASLKRRVTRDAKWKKLVDALARANYNASTATAIAEAWKVKAALVAGRTP
jgi:hypothetical protein